jgi:cytochrome c peroxidase
MDPNFRPNDGSGCPTQNVATERARREAYSLLLPLGTVRCNATGKIVQVTDLGPATVTGKCADIGKFKGPILRGLAGRAPYFHNGSAATLMDALDLYDTRFSLNLSQRDKNDLVALLSALQVL